MTQELIDAAVDLVGLLARENEALGQMDLARAAAMVGAKRRAAEAFAEASGGAESTARLAPPLQRQLAELAEENRRLLERAMKVQGRVMGTIAGAMARRAREQGGYGANGARTAHGKAPALTLSARA